MNTLPLTTEELMSQKHLNCFEDLIAKSKSFTNLKNQK